MYCWYNSNIKIKGHNILKFEKSQFEAFENILEMIDMDIDTINELITQKYGEYAHGYFIKKIENSIDKEEFIFHTEVELIIGDLTDPEDKSEIVLEYAIEAEDIYNDGSLQRCFEIKEDIVKLENSISLSSSKEEIQSVDKTIFYLTREYNDKQAVISLRGPNYYENKRMYAES